MNIQEVRKTVGKIKSSLFKNSNSYSIGMLKSHFKGTGLQFKEHQVYVPGDDVRFIDWKILAKTGNPYIKTFDEERNVEICVVLDVSPTMFFGDNGVSKLQAGIELCCLLYLLAKETNDNVRVLIVGEDLVDIPKKSGDEGIIQFISILQEKGILDSDGRVNLSYQFTINEVSEDSKYRSIMKHIAKKRELVIFSDFNDLVSMSHLKRLLFRKNVHCFQITCPLDRTDSFPFMLNVSEVSTNKKAMKKINFKESEEFNFKLGKRVKSLKVEDRYLEDFIKEMI